MKKTVILLIILLASVNFSTVWAQTQQYASVSVHFSKFNYTDNDSLMFDGSNSNINYYNIVADCNLKVTKVKGKAYGTILTMKIEDICGEIDTMYKLTYGQLKAGDIVISEGFLRTQDFSLLEVELKDGKKVWLGPLTEFKMGKDYCFGNGMAQLLSGEIHVEGSGGNGNTYINTGPGIIAIKNTKFSIEIVKEGDVLIHIIKVFEGSVTFQKNMQKEDNTKSEDIGAQMNKLTEDFQNGKISVQEFSKQMTELQKDITNAVPKSPVTVNAGYMSKMVGNENPIDPVAFDVNENLWFDDANFK